MTHRSEVRSNVRVRGAAVALWLACALMAGAETAAAERAPVTAQVAPVVTTVVAPIAPVAAPVVAPVAAPITTVTSTVNAPVAPIVNDVTAPRGGLLGKRK